MSMREYAGIISKDLVKDMLRFFKNIEGQQVLRPVINIHNEEYIRCELQTIDTQGFIKELEQILKED